MASDRKQCDTAMPGTSPFKSTLSRMPTRHRKAVADFLVLTSYKRRKFD
jgi:hypothetical protein